MVRPLKFRAWLKDKKEPFYFSFLDMVLGNACNELDEESVIEINLGEKYPNGDDVYEGVKTDGHS